MIARFICTAVWWLLFAVSTIYVGNRIALLLLGDGTLADFIHACLLFPVCTRLP